MGQLGVFVTAFGLGQIARLSANVLGQLAANVTDFLV